MLLYTKAMQLLSLIRLWIPFRWKVTWEWNTNAIILALSNDCIPIPQAGCLLQCFDTVDAFAGQIFCKVVLIIWLIVHHVCEDMRTNSFFTASTGNFRRWLLPRNRGGRPTNSINQELADLNFTLVVTLKCELNPWPTLHSISSERTKWWKTYGSLG